MCNALYPKYTDGKLDPEVERFLTMLARVKSMPLRLLSSAEVRKRSSVLGWIQSRGDSPTITNITIPVKDAQIPARIYVPGGPGPYPVLLYFHGGGWVFGSLDEADHICAIFACRTPAIIVSVDYRLSPEHKYPCALEDAYAALLFVHREIARFGGDPARIGVAGESAGANIATVLCQMAQDRQGPKIGFQLLLCPAVDLLHRDTPSYALFGEGPWLSTANIDYYYGQYLNSPEEAREPYASPLLCESLVGLPPAHIVTAEFDVLRDEGQAYAQRLAEAGVPVTYKMYEGMIHSFFVLNKVFKRANEAMEEFVGVLRNHLR